MINHLDNLLRDLFMTQILNDDTTPGPLLPSDEHFGFRPPDDDWRTQVNDLSELGSQLALNIYLFDLRENRTLRSNERVRTTENGVVIEEPGPARIDCHYLITAWRRRVTETNEWILGYVADEHSLLYKAMAVLMNQTPLNPSRIYDPGSTELAAVPLLIREADLPTQILPVEGFPKYAEFWGTMGTNHRWKPAIYLVVTLPVPYTAQETGHIVTTRVMDAGPVGQLDATDSLVQIAGHVLEAAGDVVSGAWVRLEDSHGAPLQVTHTDTAGRYTFDGLQPGEYQLRWRARGFSVPSLSPASIQVPSSTGDYDLRFN